VLLANACFPEKMAIKGRYSSPGNFYVQEIEEDAS
jgi:hypothetical protein